MQLVSFDFIPNQRHECTRKCTSKALACLNSCDKITRVVMAQGINKLSDRAINAKKAAGRYADGGGLYLQVQPGGSRTFIFMKTYGGKRQVLGLGAYPAVTLAAARTKAFELRKQFEEGELAELVTAETSLSEAHHQLQMRRREEKRLAAQKEEARVTFSEFSKDWMDKNLVSLSNPKARQQWYNTLRDYAKPIAGLPVDEIKTEHVLNCLKPIWQTKPETARRVQQRIERVLAAAEVLGLRDGKNPAQWNRNLDLLLPNMRSLRQHHPAMPYSKLPDYFAELSGRYSCASQCLRFIILTAVRSSEGRGALWSEIDFEKSVWTIPPERMKARKEQRIPLSSACLALLVERRSLDTSGFVFKSPTIASHVSEAALRNLMSGTGANDYTIHGFRSTFRDWAGNATSFPRELAEEALAHQLGSVEAAYRRDLATERRRELMESWSQYATSAK